MLSFMKSGQQRRKVSNGEYPLHAFVRDLDAHAYRRKKADEIYRLGLARKAAPLERLKTRHHAFLERIMVAPGQPIPHDEPVLDSTRTPARSVLGSVASLHTSVSGATQLAPSNRVSQGANGAKLEVFTDTTGREDDPVPGEWADLGTRDGRRKENATGEAGPWKGEILLQSATRGRVAPRTPKVEVFKDSVRLASLATADGCRTKMRLSRWQRMFSRSPSIRSMKLNC